MNANAYETAKRLDLERLAKFARSHGFYTRVGYDFVAVSIPVTLADGQACDDIFQARSMTELRAILGY